MIRPVQANSGHLEHVLWVFELMPFLILAHKLTVSNRYAIRYFHFESETKDFPTILYGVGTLLPPRKL